MLKLYTPLIRDCVNFAFEAHDGQKDKAGFPVILHPLAVASQMETEEGIIVALLHDVIEDTSATLDYLREAGVPEKCVKTIALLSRSLLVYGNDEAASYEDYIKCVMQNFIACKVKIADMKHNLLPERIAMLPEKDAERLVKKYNKWLPVLENSINED